MTVKIDVFEEDEITKFRTLEEITFTLNGTEHTVEAGFVSDGMSVPAMFWGVISPQVHAVTLKPSIIHDWLYSANVCTRKQADDLFYTMLTANGFSTLKSWLVWSAVRLFGGSHWD